MRREENKLFIKKLAKGPVCPLCNKPVTVSDIHDFEYVKSKRREEHFYHGSCIDEYFHLPVVH